MAEGRKMNREAREDACLSLHPFGGGLLSPEFYLAAKEAGNGVSNQIVKHPVEEELWKNGSRRDRQSPLTQAVVLDPFVLSGTRWEVHTELAQCKAGTAQSHKRCIHYCHLHDSPVL